MRAAPTRYGEDVLDECGRGRDSQLRASGDDAAKTDLRIAGFYVADGHPTRHPI